MSFLIGDLLVKLGLDSGQVVSGGARVERAMEGMAAGAGNVAGQFAKLAAQIAGPAILLHFISGAYEAIDATEKLSYRLGSTVAELQVVQHAANLAGIAKEGLAKQTGILTGKLAEAARTGTGPAYEAMRRLGLSAKELADLPLDQKLGKIADAFEKLHYSTAQQVAVLRQLGIRGTEVVEMLGEGSGAFKTAREELEKFGVLLSRVDAQKIVQANDAWTTTKLVMQQLGNVIAIETAPSIKAVAEHFQKAAKAGDSFRGTLRTIIDSGRDMYAGFVSQTHEMEIDWDEFIAFVLNTINKLGEGWNELLDKPEKVFKDLKMLLGSVITSLGVQWKSFVDYITNPQAWFADFKAATDEIPSFSIPRFEKIEHSYGQLREKLGKAPSVEEWKAYWEAQDKAAQTSAEKAAKLRDEAAARKGAQTDPLSEQQREALEKKFLALQHSLANEAAVIDISRQEELKKLEEFEKKKIGTAEQWAYVRLQMQDKAEKERQQLIWSKIDETIATELQKEEYGYQERLAALERMKQAQLLTEEGANVRLRMMAEKHSLAMAQIQAKQWSGLANIVDTSMSSISKLVGDEGKKGFTIMKAIASATALVKGYEAVMGAYAAGNVAGGPAVGAAFAAIAAAGVAAQIAALYAVQPGGGGTAPSAPSAGGGAGSSAGGAGGAEAAPAAPGRTLYVEGLNAPFYSRKEIRSLMSQIEEYQRDGGRVVVNS